MTAAFGPGAFAMIHEGIHTAPSTAVIRGLMRNRAPAWAVLVLYPGPRDQWHVWAGHHTSDESEARRTWDAVKSLVEHAKGIGEQISAALVGPPRSVAPTETTIERGVQVTLTPKLARACRTCGEPMPANPGRPGRPRAHCNTCRPPSWPRRGEHWLFEGQRVVVLGSTKRQQPRVRVRPVDCAHVREIPRQEWSSGAVRLHHTSKEAS